MIILPPREIDLYANDRMHSVSKLDLVQIALSLTNSDVNILSPGTADGSKTLLR